MAKFKFEVIEGSVAVIPAWQSFQWKEVRVITEMKNGCIYKTKKLGCILSSELFAHLKNDGYIKGYSFTSVSVSSKETIVLEPLLKIVEEN